MVLAHARDCHGVTTTTNLRRAGLSPWAQVRRVDAHVLEPAGRGVLVVPELRDRLTDLAAIQARCPSLVAERRTAAAVWDWDGFRTPGPPPLDLALTEGRAPRFDGLPSLRRAAIPAGAIEVVDGIRVTTATWTLADLGAAEDVDVDHVELAMENALRRRLTSEARMGALMERYSGPGNWHLRQALARRPAGTPPTESYPETRFLQLVVRPLGIEDPERQVEVPSPSRHPYRCDFLFRRARLLDVEIDGRDTHDGDHDSIRDHHLKQRGIDVARFAAWRVERRTAELTERLLRELGAVS